MFSLERCSCRRVHMWISSSLSGNHRLNGFMMCVCVWVRESMSRMLLTERWAWLDEFYWFLLPAQWAAGLVVCGRNKGERCLGEPNRNKTSQTRQCLWSTYVCLCYMCLLCLFFLKTKNNWMNKIFFTTPQSHGSFALLTNDKQMQGKHIYLWFLFNSSQK